MPHQCVHCSKIFPDAAEELLKGCECSGKFFYYIRQEKADEIERINSGEIEEVIKELEHADKEQIEKDIREITGMENQPERPVILDLESVRVIHPGKFEIDIVNLFNKRRPLVYKLEEGKYIIDLNASIKIDRAEVDRKIVDVEYEKEEEEE